MNHTLKLNIKNCAGSYKRPPVKIFYREGILLGVGSPLLDISAQVGNGYLER